MTRNLIKAYPLGRQEGRTRVRDFTTLYVMYTYYILYNHRRASAVCEFSRRAENGYIFSARQKKRRGTGRRWPPENMVENGTACGRPCVLGGAVSFHAAPNKKIFSFI